MLQAGHACEIIRELRQIVANRFPWIARLCENHAEI
jgi:hypothetical protein